MTRVEKLVMLAVRLASGQKPSSKDKLEAMLARMLAETIIDAREVGGVKILYCNLCGKGPFTPKGLYLHMIRVHIDEVSVIIDRLIYGERW